MHGATIGGATSAAVHSAAYSRTRNVSGAHATMHTEGRLATREADPMLYRITYRPEVAQPAETVEADRVDVESGVHIVLRGTAIVVGQPREIVVRRLRAADVLAVTEIAPEVSGVSRTVEV